MITQFCGGHHHRYKNFYCSRRAVFFVTYFSDGSGGKYSCAQHLAQIVRIVAAGESVPDRAAVTVRPVTR